MGHSENLPSRYHCDPAVLVVLEPLVVMEFSSRSGVHGPSDHRPVQVTLDKQIGIEWLSGLLFCNREPSRGSPAWRVLFSTRKSATRIFGHQSRQYPYGAAQQASQKINDLSR